MTEMNNCLPGLFAAVWFAALTGCSSSSDSTDKSVGEPVQMDETKNSSTLRLEQTTMINSGLPNLIVNTEYTEAGNLLQQTFVENENTVKTRTFQTTNNGLLVRRSEDINLDGVEDLASQFVYNSSDSLSRIEKLDASGLIDRIDFYAFQNGFAIARESRDIDDVSRSDNVNISSGTLESLRTFEYEEGRVVAINIDSNGDGVFDLREDYTYNLNGTLATSSLSSVANGVIGANTYAYEQGPCRLWGDTTTAYFCVDTE